MEFRQIRYFIAVAEERNLSAASRRLRVSQPPITRQIHQLEAELGVALFRRTSRGVELTAAGVAFLPEARKMIDLSHRAVQRSMAAAQGQIGRLDVGYFGSTIYHVVPSLIRRFCVSLPEVGVHLRRADKDEQIARLRDGTMSVGFARYFPAEPDLETVCVARERLYIAREPSSSRRKRAALADLHDGRVVVFPRVGRPSFADEIMRLLSQASVTPRIIDEAEDALAALALVAINKGACIVPESVALLRWPGLEFAQISDVSAVSPVHCIFLRNDRQPVTDAFLGGIQKIS